jgi:hypothetical protein
LQAGGRSLFATVARPEMNICRGANIPFNIPFNAKWESSLGAGNVVCR